MAKVRRQDYRLLLLTLAICVISCNNSRTQLERMVDSFSRETIRIPSGLIKVYEGEIIPTELKADLPKMVYWFDSTECSLCNAKRLGYMDRLYTESLEYGPFDILLIFSPNTIEAETTLESLRLYDLAHPVLLDPEQLFQKENPRMEKYPFFHRFYLDKYGHPQFIGDPLSSEAMWAVFEKRIKEKDR